MKGFWKKRSEPAERKGVPETALREASQEELAHEALLDLTAGEKADRFGVWLESSPENPGAQEGSFAGEIWDRENESTPREWKALSPQSVLPLGRLLAGEVIETELGEHAAQPLVGPVTGLRNALWVPVCHAGKLRGILLAGTNAPQRVLPKELMQGVAAELALALALKTERKLARERYTDIGLFRRILTGLKEHTAPEELLQEITDSCVAISGRTDNPGALFAFVGKIRDLRETVDGTNQRVQFLSEAGEKRWLQSAQSGPVAELWKNALKNGRTMGSEIRSHWSKEEALRVIAVPIALNAGTGGALVAGFRPANASLSALERVETRGTLAGSVLAAIEEREEREQQAEKERALLEASRSPMLLLGPRMAIADSNQAARVLLSNLPAALGSDSSAGPHPDLAGKQLAELLRVRDRGKIESWQRQLMLPGGSHCAESPDVELDSGARVRLEARCAGESVHVVTLLPRGAAPSAEESSAQAELLNLVEWLDQGVILFDAQENVRMMNLRFAQLAGFTPEETERCTGLDSLIERLKTQSADPETFARRWRELARQSEGGEREEVHLLRPAARVLERASRPVLDAHGKKLGRIELYKDLTAQRVFQAKLLQTERMAALGQMVSSVAHELSNPLTSILGYAQRMLLRTDANSNFEEVRKIFAEAERAGAILRRMLLAARETSPERKLVPLNQIVQRTIELQRFSLAAERIRVDVSLDSSLPQVMGDAGQLQQVLMNLLGNARQAIEQLGHGGTIRVRTLRTEDNRVCLEVSDSGPGVPEGIMARIFDPFFTTKPAGVGTGLGLSIVLSLVREHGGQVHVSSPRGSGAIFRVELPAAEHGEAAERTGKKAVRLPGMSSHEAVGTASAKRAAEAQRILVVEDEPTVSQLIADVLRDEGFEVDVLLDGRGAAERIARERFDLVICDMKMPNLDGQSLFDSLSPARKELQKRFLFVTGDVLGARTHDFLTKNRLPHVAKPFRVEELLEKVHQVLQPVAIGSSRRVAALKKNSATTG